MAEADFSELIAQRQSPGALQADTLDALLAEHPEHPVLLWLRAAPPFWDQDWAQARAWMDRAHAAGLDRDDFLLDRIEAWISDPQLPPEQATQAAQQAYERLGTHAEHGPVVRDQLWRALREEGAQALQDKKPQRAKGLFQRALAVSDGADEVTRTRLSLGITQLNLAQPQAALPHLEAARVAQDPSVRARVASTAATAWVRLSRVDRAREVLEQAIGTLAHASPERDELLQQKRALAAGTKPKASRGKKKGRKRR